jgi:hypothetical protein
VADEGEKAVVVIDGVESEQYDEIGLGTPVFSPDSRKVAYAARQGSKWFVVADGVKSKAYDDINPATLIFSPDSQKLSYAASYDNGWCMVVNGVEGKKYGYIWEDSPLFSPDSQHLAYVAGSSAPYSESAQETQQTGAAWFVVLDEVEGPYFIDMASNSLVFSPDSQRLAYSALSQSAHSGEQVQEEGGEHSHEDEKWCVVVDGEKQKDYSGTGQGTIVFSPDSQHIAYVAATATNWFVVCDGEEQKMYEGIGNAVIFSQDSKWLVYVGRTEGKSYVVVNANEGKPYDGILISWGGRLEFASPDTLQYLAVNGEEFYLVEETIKEAEKGK